MKHSLLFLFLLVQSDDAARISRGLGKQLPDVEAQQMRSSTKFDHGEMRQLDDVLHSTATKKPHVHQHHKKSGEFVDKKKNLEEVGLDDVTAKNPENSEHHHLPKTFIELDNHRTIKCARNLKKTENVSTHIFGEYCCDAEIEEVLTNVKEYPDEFLGDTAKRVQRQIQKIYQHAFDVILSSKDFVVASYYHGQRMCKINVNGLYALAYQNPSKYNISFYEREAWLAGIDAQEDLGSTLEIERDDWADIRLDPLANLGVGTHCIREKRTGNKCCYRQLYDMMVTVIDQTATSPVFNTSCETKGVIANVVKKRVQQRFARIFEVIVSEKDFVQATYATGDFTCKFKRKGLFILAFETPKQEGYHPYDKEEELEYSGLTDADPLGTPLERLPGENLTNTRGIELETEGYRIGFPKGTHCDHNRMDGMKCCHMDLFASMYAKIQDMKADDLFSSIDRRIIATRLRRAAEESVNEPLEMIVADREFVVAGQQPSEHRDFTCKFKADNYHIMAWRTPGNYSVGMDQFADNGVTSFVGCKINSSILEVVYCEMGFLDQLADCLSYKTSLTFS